MRKLLILFVSVLIESLSVRAGQVWLEAESFGDKGGWVVDQQFMDIMGSPYLLAHGMGCPVADATAEVIFPEAGTYHVYVRTYNWTSPWHKGEGPGKFKLKVGRRLLPVILGSKGDGWMWQYAGKVSVRNRKKTLQVALKDLTGFDGRCDAIYFTTEASMPPVGGRELADFRRKLQCLPPARVLDFDFVVAGGGIAGMCAAVSAARRGCKVALINDRPVLGGNNSAEVRVHLGGFIEEQPYPALGRMIREFGHLKGGNAQPASYYEDEKKLQFILAEKNITLFANYHVNAAQTRSGQILSLTAQHIENGTEITLRAPLFADCTGDGTLGVLAGADYRMGREGREEFGESLAPEKADKMTMGASVQWYSTDAGHRTKFPEFRYGIDFNEANCEKVKMGEWTWETGMNFDQITDFERIRDYGLLVVYSNWSFLKNKLKDRDAYRNRSLEWVAYVAGKRESRRLLGDYILKQDDIQKNVFHEDASFTTTWSIDLHFPDPKNLQHFPDAPFKATTKHIYIYPYAVPYRCLYSRNVDNLFMAGRNISVTHVALGTVRVMRTTGMMGEVVGLAASLCKKYDTTPRGIYQDYLGELKTLMKEGAAKPGYLPDNQHFNTGKKLDSPQTINR